MLRVRIPSPAPNSLGVLVDMQLDTSKLELPGVHKLALARRVVQFLNEVFKTDPEAITALFAHRVPVNDALADHLTVQVTEGNPPTMSVIGLLNGFVGVISGADLTGFLCSIYDDHEPAKLLGFRTHQRAEDEFSRFLPLSK